MRYVVWECDKCRAKVGGDDAPRNWLKATVQELDFKTGLARSPTEILKHWCGSCWREIERKVPTESEGP